MNPRIEADVMLTLRELRERNGFTQADLADALQMHPSSIRAWETGESRPTNEQLMDYARVIGVDLRLP